MMNYQLLSQCPVFQGISEDENRKLLEQILFQIRKFEKDEIIAIEGEPVKNLRIILSGSVRAEMIDYSGKTVKIDDIETAQPLASAFIFGEENNYPVTVTANTPGRLLVVSVQEFLKLLQLNRQVLENYLNSISTRAQFLSQKIHFLSFKTIKEKMAHFLLKQAGEQQNTIELKNTQQQLADLFGVARPSLARVFSEMQREGLIEIKRKRVTILDKPALNEILKNE